MQPGERHRIVITLSNDSRIFIRFPPGSNEKSTVVAQEIVRGSQAVSQVSMSWIRGSQGQEP